MKAVSTPNIALIKYWGNRNNRLRVPAADSLSITLNGPTVTVDVEATDVFSVISFDANNQQTILAERDLKRWQGHADLIREYLDSLGLAKHVPRALAVAVRSEVPPRIGLASSAAVFSAFAKAAAGLLAESIALTDEQISIMARLGSGSAARSICGGFTAMHVEEGDGIGAAYAAPIADEKHWPLHDVIVVPSHEEKSVGSTEGHALADTSPYFEDRIKAIQNRRQRECIEAILAKDFERLQAVTEEDCLDMHHVMETSNPPLCYLSEVTHRLVRDMKEVRKQRHVPVLYTMDAGPTVHLICLPEAHSEILAFAKEQADCTVYDMGMGTGARLLSSP